MILRRHAILSNQFSTWVRSEGAIRVRQEESLVDVSFFASNFAFYGTGGIGTLSFGLSFGLASKNNRSANALHKTNERHNAAFPSYPCISKPAGIFLRCSPELCIVLCPRMGCLLSLQIRLETNTFRRTVGNPYSPVERDVPSGQEHSTPGIYWGFVARIFSVQERAPLFLG